MWKDGKLFLTLITYFTNWEFSTSINKHTLFRNYKYVFKYVFIFSGLSEEIIKWNSSERIGNVPRAESTDPQNNNVRVD